MTVWMVSFTLNVNYSVWSLFLDIDISNPETKAQLYQTKNYSRNTGNISSPTSNCVTPAPLNPPLDTTGYLGHLAPATQLR